MWGSSGSFDCAIAKGAIASLRMTGLGVMLVLVTHDPALAAHAGRRITLRDGLVVGDEVQVGEVQVSL